MSGVTYASSFKCFRRMIWDCLHIQMATRLHLHILFRLDLIIYMYNIYTYNIYMYNIYMYNIYRYTLLASVILPNNSPLRDMTDQLL